MENEYFIIGIFDGHGKDGHRVASVIRQEFLLSFLQSGNFSQNEGSGVMQHALSNAEKYLIQNTSVDSKRSGCTANIALFNINSEHQLNLTSLNVGDSE